MEPSVDAAVSSAGKLSPAAPAAVAVAASPLCLCTTAVVAGVSTPLPPCPPWAELPQELLALVAARLTTHRAPPSASEDGEEDEVARRRGREPRARGGHIPSALASPPGEGRSHAPRPCGREASAVASKAIPACKQAGGSPCRRPEPARPSGARAGANDLQRHESSGARGGGGGFGVAAAAAAAAMRAVCRSWRLGAAPSVASLPRWLLLGEALTPPDSWPAVDRVRELAVLLTGRMLAGGETELRGDALRAELHARLTAIYPGLETVRWQVQDALPIVNAQLSWCVCSNNWVWREPQGGPCSPRTSGGTADGDGTAVDGHTSDGHTSDGHASDGLSVSGFSRVPDLLMDSVVCPERRVTITSVRVPWAINLQGPVTLRALLHGVRDSGRRRLDAVERQQRVASLTVKGVLRRPADYRRYSEVRWDLAAGRVYFRGLVREPRTPHQAEAPCQAPLAGCYRLVLTADPEEQL